MKMIAITAAALCLAGASNASAQDEAARRAAVEVAARVPFERAMKGAPYSGETVIEGAQTLADGNRISYRTTGRVYRDGEGRTRREEDRKDGSVAVSIVDPVAGFSYSLDAQNKIAWRTTIGAAGAIIGKVEASAAAARKAEEQKVQEKMTAEGRSAAGETRMIAPSPAPPVAGGAMMRSRGGVVAPQTPLEHKTIDGVPVEGRKTTTVIPAGQIGNEQPLTILSEEWRSPDLNVLVQTHHSDPRTGESSYRLQNLVRAEPDPSLFIVPADYTVKDSGIRRMLESSRR